jgi:hypothetical protein
LSCAQFQFALLAINAIVFAATGNGGNPDEARTLRPQQAVACTYRIGPVGRPDLLNATIGGEIVS